MSSSHQRYESFVAFDEGPPSVINRVRIVHPKDSQRFTTRPSRAGNKFYFPVVGTRRKRVGTCEEGLRGKHIVLGPRGQAVPRTFVTAVGESQQTAPRQIVLELATV